MDVASFLVEKEKEVAVACNDKEDVKSAIAFAKELSISVHSMGIALSCDFMKECGCICLVKTDIHIIKIYNVIFQKEIPDALI